MKSETRIVANTLLSLFARAVRAMVALLLIPFLLARLGEETYGVIGVINSVLGFVTLIEFGIRPAMTREFARFLYSGDHRRSNELVSTAMGAYCLLAVVILGAIRSLSSPILARFHVPPAVAADASSALTIAALTLGAALLATPYTAALFSRLRYDIRHLADILESLLRGGLIVLLFWAWEPRLVCWAIGGLAGSLLVLLLVRWQARVRCPSLQVRPALVSRRGVRDLASSGAYTSVAQISDWMSIQSGPLIISYFLGTARVAHYVPAMVLATMLHTFSRAFLLQLHPFLTKAFVDQDHARTRRVLQRSTRYTILLTGGAAVWTASFSTLITSCWLGAGFSDTARVMALWCISVFLHCCVGGAFPVFIGAGRFGFVARSNVFLAVICVATGVALVGFAGQGVTGVAIAILVTQVGRTSLWIISSARIARLSMAEYFGSSYAGPLACIALLAIVSAASQRITHSVSWYGLGLVGVPPLLIFLGAAWRIGLQPDDRARALGYAHIGCRRVLSLSNRPWRNP